MELEHSHSKALAALQPFVHLAQTTSAPSPRFAATLITNATSSPQTYVFAELLDTPAVQALASPACPRDLQAYLKLLQIFAWGTWRDYEMLTATATPNLPPLNAAQTLKLRLLSLLSLSAASQALTYETLMGALSLASPAELESLVTKAVYASLLVARLRPASDPPTVAVAAVAPLRDLAPHSLPAIAGVLAAWQARCAAVVAEIDAHVLAVTAAAHKRHAAAAALAAQPDTGAAAAGAGAGGGAAAGSNKREFDDDHDATNGAADEDEDGLDPVGVHSAESRMDIDGSATRRVARHAKRLLGRKS